MPEDDVSGMLEVERRPLLRGRLRRESKEERNRKKIEKYEREAEIERRRMLQREKMYHALEKKEKYKGAYTRKPKAKPSRLGQAIGGGLRKIGGHYADMIEEGQRTKKKPKKKKKQRQLQPFSTTRAFFG